MGTMRAVKQFFKNRYPDRYRALKNVFGNLDRTDIDWLVLRACQERVVAGPFRGMRYIGPEGERFVSAKVLGTYERELHPIVEQLVSTGYRSILNVGSAEGYYAVGLARRLHTASIRAFDTDAVERQRFHALADINQVSSRVAIDGPCTDSIVGEAGAIGRCLIICDIEGAEVEFLDPSRLPSLYGIDLLVEIHEADKTSVSVRTLLLNRFAATHSARLVSAERRLPAECERLTCIRDPKRRIDAINEGRQAGFEWLFLTVAK